MSIEIPVSTVAPHSIATFENNQTCPICLDDFTEITTHPPITLGCQHLLCRECFEGHFKVCIQQNRDVECPVCRGLICKNVLPVVVQVDTPHRVVVLPPQDLCMNRTMITAPLVAIIIVIIVLLIWSASVKHY